MKFLQAALCVTAFGCLTAFPFIFLPLNAVNEIITRFGAQPFPNLPSVVYLFRIACAIICLIGVFFVILALNPMRYGPMLRLGAYGLIIFGVLSLVFGSTLELPKVVFIGDGAAGLILGTLIATLAKKADLSAS